MNFFSYGVFWWIKRENELLDDMVFDRYGKVKCSKIEGMLPKLMVEGEETGLGMFKELMELNEKYKRKNQWDSRKCIE